ncbi:hypothetical protein TRFO_16400 [Tritrichomonas foetus]|uniref:Uncharacterized protein n=1 Tax=Tritrichomonas foetus TaxID=1144522 RepID=A0A1J4KUI3_9EUKA|nr:hypothetical protein TRFO_16400 [Tritrichomonas foetus]|eukprot:OHT13420.1 hypothetical protein TRFO_16400 [Tritrichomonas foetus]
MSQVFSQDYIPIHYDLHLHMNKNNRTIEALVNIQFQKIEIKKGECNLLIHSNIQIHRISQEKVQLKYLINGKNLKIFGDCFHLFPVTIEYSVTPLIDDQQGFYRYDDEVILTHFQPNDMPSLFPCYDGPEVQASFSLTITHPSDIEALSNMQSTCCEGKNGEIVDIFEQTPPMCSYLFCIALGHFSKIESFTKGRKVPVIFYSDSHDATHLKEYLNVACQCIDWIEKKFKVNYQLPHLQILAHHGFNTGMENYGLITIPYISNAYFQVDSILLILHEIVHLWFGDLVSIKSWDSLWLNEGFAELLPYYILNDLYPELDIWKYYLKKDCFSAFTLYSTGTIIKKLDELSIDHEKVFSVALYSKSCFVLKMFAELISLEKFYALCSSYLEQYKGKNVNTNDFLQYSSSFLDFDTGVFFKNWLHNIGFPVLVIDDNGNITQNSDDNSIYYFQVPIIYEYNNVIHQTNVIISQKKTKLMFQYDWIYINPNMQSLCYVVYSEALLKALVVAKKEGKINEIDINYLYKSTKALVGTSYINNSLLKLSREFSEFNSKFINYQ